MLAENASSLLHTTFHLGFIFHRLYLFHVFVHEILDHLLRILDTPLKLKPIFPPRELLHSDNENIPSEFLLPIVKVTIFIVLERNVVLVVVPLCVCVRDCRCCIYALTWYRSCLWDCSVVAGGGLCVEWIAVGEIGLSAVIARCVMFCFVGTYG